MRNVFFIARRELEAYFASPIGWIALCAFLLVTGFFFASMVGFFALQTTEFGMSPYQDIDLSQHLVAPFYSNTGLVLLMLCPALSMRLFAEDRRQRSLEMLLTSPVRTVEIVLGKYFGGMGFVLVMLLATAHYPLILWWIGEPDLGVVISSYLALLGVAGSVMAVGLVASAATESQMVAFVVSFVLSLLFWVASWADASASGTLGEVLSYLSMLSHMDELGKGLLHVKDLVYYVSFIAVALFATHQRVEAFRWR
ncbi:MAG: ABC transporter permease [Deltaproteobacteria bacterium]|nr:ABC transporter permease [Deltaproteobacteria bacterium]